MSNQLFYGDNLKVLRDSIASESVDLIYLDPPFNSNASYNVLFKSPSGEQSAAQIEAFDDTWHWTISAQNAFDEVLTGQNSDASIMLKAMHSALGENDMMAYIAMMSVRLIELHRVLKQNGSLYLHCDATASHYLKIMLDSIFGMNCYRNEIIWRRTPFAGSSKAKAQQLPKSHDVILFYSKGSEWTWHGPNEPYSEEYLNRFKWDDEDGRGPYRKTLLKTYSQDTFERLKKDNRLIDPTKSGAMYSYKQYLAESSGFRQIDDIWIDINALNPVSKERLGYPTQKPVALLERIILASSNEGDIVLDPFCGCGTTVHAAQKLKRKWIGIDVTHLAVSLIEHRLKAAFPGIKYEVHGVPKDAAAARDLAERDKHEFQKWIVASIEGQPYKGGRKGMDRGIDGYLHFRDADKKPQIAIISVKGGGIKSGDIRDLKGTMEREGAALGIFLTLNMPTREMIKEAASAGFYETGGRKFPRLQILTAEQVIDNRRPEVPFGFTESLKTAPREKDNNQGSLL